MDYISIGFVYNALEGTTQVILWDEDSKALRFKDSDAMSASAELTSDVGFLNDVCGHPAPEDVYTDCVQNV